jgi:hypothetical protein
MEILNTYSVYNDILTILPIFPLGVAVFFSLKTIFELLDKEWKNAIISLLIVVACFGIFTILTQQWSNSKLVRYEVVISDYNKVNFDEYKIIENRGKIVILEEIKN